ncbi:MAG: outer membrane beta-barrel protein [Proteobacteria bacterium]|nr:outer membrane beta-barrel protein [Pseudomonadota bacterium]
MPCIGNCWHIPWGTFLVGARGGYGERLGDVNITLVYTSPLEDIPSSFIIEDYTDFGYRTGIFAGYQIQCGRFVLGAEFSIDWDNMQDAHYFSFSDANGQVELPGFAYAAMARYDYGVTYGLSARLGYQMSHCFMPYFRLGLEQSDDTLTVAFAGFPTIYNFSVITQGESRQLRYVAGIGFEAPLPFIPFVTYRVEYDYHSRGKNAEALGIINDGLGFNPFFMSKIHPKTHTLDLALVWNFAI